MNIDKVITRFAATPCNPVELRRVARVLGSELCRENVATLERFRAELARVSPLEAGAGSVDSPSYAAGYVAGLLDVTAERETHVRHDVSERELGDMVEREGWLPYLMLLRDGPRLPSELAEALGQERSTVTRTLRKLRAAGLVRVYPSALTDGRKRPHRLTVEGRRLVAELDSGLSDDMARGIRVAVGLFQHLLKHPSGSLAALDQVAGEALDDSGTANRAVSVWAEECARLGLITAEVLAHAEPASEADALADTEVGIEIGADTEYSDGIPLPILAQGSLATPRSDALWHTAPELLHKLSKGDAEPLPVYVRTSDESWGAWAYALVKEDAPGRTIVDGDIVAHSVQPPEQRFLLIYDDPHAIRADRDEPTMQEFMSRAESKFVVTQPGDNPEDVPDDFHVLRLTPEREPSG